MTTRKQLDHFVLDATLHLNLLDEGDAGDLADDVIDHVIAKLRSDPRLPRRTFDEWSLFFANLRSDIERWVADLVDGAVDYNEMTDAIVMAMENSHIAVPTNGGGSRP